MPSLRDMIDSMNNLPNTQSQGNNNPVSPPVDPQQSGGIGSKEKSEGGAASVEVSSLKETGQEVPIAPEVGAAGVRLHPTTVTIPPQVAQLGVKQVSDTSVTQQVQTIALPLSDDQIAQGLHQGISSSWRWLAQWCVRRLKQLHMSIKKVHGKSTRVNTT